MTRRGKMMVRRTEEKGGIKGRKMKTPQAEGR
jgi:hypothetical protein